VDVLVVVDDQDQRDRPTARLLARLDHPKRVAASRPMRERGFRDLLRPRGRKPRPDLAGDPGPARRSVGYFLRR
jgi:hypothetical protein